MRDSTKYSSATLLRRRRSVTLCGVVVVVVWWRLEKHTGRNGRGKFPNRGKFPMIGM